MSIGVRAFTVMFGLGAWLTGSVQGTDWPQWRGPQSEGIWREEGILAKFPSNGPVVKWRAPIGHGYAGPSVANGCVYVMDRVTTDPSNACERVLCLDADKGSIRWQHAYPCRYNSVGYDIGPRVTPAVAGEKVYTLGVMGDLLCLDAARGNVVWQKNLPLEYQVKVPPWGYATQLLVDGPRLYCIVGGTNHAVVALDKDTGKELWRALSSHEPGYSAPILRTINGVRQLIVLHADGLAGLKPETGEVLWSVVYPSKMGMAICTPAVCGDRVCVSGQWDGTAMFQILPGLKEPALLWHANTGATPEKPFKTEGMNTVIGVGGLPTMWITPRT